MMSIKEQLIKDVVSAYKEFCKMNLLVEDRNSVEYFIERYINLDTKVGYHRAEKLRVMFQ